MQDKIVIIFNDGVRKMGDTYRFEKLEDELAILLESFGLSGRIEDSITGNRTIFPIEKEAEENE